MLIGHKDKITILKNLSDKNKLSHAYLFFGDQEIGKFLFANYLANYLEKGAFEKPTAILEELLTISPDEKKIIGIDKIKVLSKFLYQKPVFSKKRIVIINDSESMTAEAQNAVLKIVEDPPEMALIIFIAKEEDFLLSPLLSRLQKIYFSRLPSKEIEKFLSANFDMQAKRTKEIGEMSFGRIGRAIKLAENPAQYSVHNDIDKVVEDDKINEFFESLIINFRQDLIKNFPKLKEVIKRQTFIEALNTNKKLQMKAAIK